MLRQALMIVLIAVIVGIAAGAGVYGFHHLIRGFHTIAEEVSAAVKRPYLTILIPVVGMIVVAWLVRMLGPEGYGHGVPEVISAVANRRSRISVKTVALKTLASALCIGWGGAVGKVGPVAQLGSALGSLAGRVVHLPAHLVKLLVGCGSAAGIAACFNAPFAGVLFSSEVILREFDVETIVPMVIAAVVGASFSQAFISDPVAFDIPAFAPRGVGELPLFLLLGLLAGIVSVLFIKVLYVQYNLFSRWRVAWYAKAAAVGLVLGLVGLRLPEVLGVNYGTITTTLLGKLDFWTMLGVTLLLPVLTGLTLAGGGSGGVFAPCLATGAALGGAFGVVCGEVLPGTSDPGAFAVVGAAAMLAGAVRAPFTAILIVLEATGNQEILVPVMGAAVVSIFVSKALHTDSIYLHKLTLRGEMVTRGEEIGLLANMYVEDVMTTDYVSVRPDETGSRLVELSREKGRDFFPVVSGDGRLEGMVSARRLVSIVRQGEAAAEAKAQDFAHKENFLLTPEQDLLEAFREFGLRDVSALPVVDSTESRKLLAVVTREDLLARYQHEQRLRKRI